MGRRLHRSGHLAIDALVWDTHDARHAVMRRDDVANLHRMYYWLLSTTLSRPGLTGATWVLRPDENGLMHWASVHDVLDNAGRRAISTSSVLLWRRARRQYAIEQIVPTDSSTAPLIQIADLMAGLSAFFHKFFGVLSRAGAGVRRTRPRLSFALPDDNLEADPHSAAPTANAAMCSSTSISAASSARWG